MIHPERRRENLKKIEEMDRRAKVIAELENIQNHLNTGYSFAINYKSKLILETLNLLKEQEAVKPTPLTNRRYACGNCGNSLWVSGQRFCASCGKAVKWE